MKAPNQHPVWMLLILLNAPSLDAATIDDIYYSRTNVDAMFSVSADATTHATLFNTGDLQARDAIGYDISEDFFFRVEGGTLIRTDLNGNNPMTVFNFEGGQNAEDILLIPELEKIVYAQDNGASDGDKQLGILNYDGSNHLVLNESVPFLGLAYDRTTEDLYYTVSSSTLNIRKIKLDGTGDASFLTSGSHTQTSTLAIVGNTLYFGGDAIYSVSTSGGAITLRAAPDAERLEHDKTYNRLIYHDDVANQIGQMSLSDFTTSVLLGSPEIGDMTIGIVPEPRTYVSITSILLASAACLRRRGRNRLLSAP